MLNRWIASATGMLLLILLPLTAIAQTPAPDRPGDCQALQALTTETRAIHTAEHVPASEEGRAHCRITGQILPEVGFEVRMPDDWNGRFLMHGNGGFAGAIQSYFGTGVARSFTAGVNQGFACPHLFHKAPLWPAVAEARCALFRTSWSRTHRLPHHPGERPPTPRTRACPTEYPYAKSSG